MKNDRQRSRAEYLMIGINRSLFLFLLTVLAESALAEANAQEALQLNTQSYDDWYQIEIIVFKPKRPALSDELWPLEDFSYPENMVSVSTDKIAPYSLSQLNSLAMAPEAKLEPEPETIPAASSFLFEGRGSHNRALIESSNQSSVKIEDTSAQADQSGEGAEALPEVLSEVLSEVPSRVLSGALSTEQEADPELDFNQAAILLDSKRPEAYRSLPRESFTLGTIARSLRRSSKYDLAMHKAWIQPVSSSPSPILLQTGEQYDELFEIDGTLSISRSRYLHVQADLWFTQFEPKYNQSQFGSGSSIEFSELEKSYPELIRIEQNRDSFIAIQSFPLHHSRRMRRSALHYIDHPYFGILIKIEKFNNPS